MKPRPTLRGRVPAPLHRAFVRNFPLCCVDVVVRHRGRVLLVRREEPPSKGLWWFLGGRLLKNERLGEAAKRIARTEAGLGVDAVRTIGFYEVWFPTGPAPHLADGYHNLLAAILVRPRGEVRVRPDSTMSATRWVGRAEPGLDPYVRRVLRDARVFRGSRPVPDARVWSDRGRFPPG